MYRNVKQCTLFAFTIPVANVIPAYPEKVLNGSVALFQHVGNVSGPHGRSMIVSTSFVDGVTSFTTNPLSSDLLPHTPRQLNYNAILHILWLKKHIPT